MGVGAMSRPDWDRLHRHHDVSGREVLLWVLVTLGIVGLGVTAYLWTGGAR
ncbi:MAG: hypothetical protein NVSMB4_06970 [Acidimicrobiales bacterium]